MHILNNHQFNFIIQQNFNQFILKDNYLNLLHNLHFINNILLCNQYMYYQVQYIKNNQLNMNNIIHLNYKIHFNIINMLIHLNILNMLIYFVNLLYMLYIHLNFRNILNYNFNNHLFQILNNQNNWLYMVNIILKYQGNMFLYMNYKQLNYFHLMNNYQYYNMNK